MKRNIGQPRYSVFLSPLRLQMFLQSAVSQRRFGQMLHLPTKPDSGAHMTHRQKHRRFLAWLQNNGKIRNRSYFSLYVIYYLQSSSSQKISFSKLLPQKSFKKHKAFLKAPD